MIHIYTDDCTSSFTTEPSAEILLDYQRLTVNATHTTIFWKFYNRSCSSSVSFELQLYLCNSTTPFKKWSTSNLYITLQSSAFGLLISGSESFLTVSALNSDGSECTTMAAWIQIKPESECGQAIRLVNSVMHAEIRV